MSFETSIRYQPQKNKFSFIESAILVGTPAELDQAISDVGEFDFNFTVENNETLLMIAVKKGNDYAVARLLSLKCKVLEVDTTGKMAFHYAVESVNPRILKRISHSADDAQRQAYTQVLGAIQNQDDKVNLAKAILNAAPPRLSLTATTSASIAAAPASVMTVPTATSVVVARTAIPVTATSAASASSIALFVPSQNLQIVNYTHAFFLRTNPYQGQGPVLNFSNTQLQSDPLRSGHLRFIVRQLQKPNAPQITQLDLSNNSVIETRFMVFRPFTRTRLDYAGIQSLVLLLSNGSLAHLNLSNCGLNDTAVQHLMDVMHPDKALKNLRELNLSYNRDITDSMARKLGAAIFSHPDTGEFLLHLEGCDISEDTQMALHQTKTNRLLTDIRELLENLKKEAASNNLDEPKARKKLATYLNPEFITKHDILLDEFDGILKGHPANKSLPEVLERAKKRFQEARDAALPPSLIILAQEAIARSDDAALFNILIKHLNVSVSHDIFHHLFTEFTDATPALSLTALSSNLPIRPLIRRRAIDAADQDRQTFLELLLRHQATPNQKVFHSVLDSVVWKLYEQKQGKMSLAAARILPPERVSYSFRKCIELLNDPISKSHEETLASLAKWSLGFSAAADGTQSILALLQAVAMPASPLAAGVAIAAPHVIASTFGFLFFTIFLKIVYDYSAKQGKKNIENGFMNQSRKAIQEKILSADTVSTVFAEMFIKRYAEILVRKSQKEANALIARFVELFAASKTLSSTAFKKKFDEQFDIFSLHEQILKAQTGGKLIPEAISAADFIDMLIHVITSHKAVPEDEILGGTPLYLPTAQSDCWRYATGPSGQDLSVARVARIAPRKKLYPIPSKPITPDQSKQLDTTLWHSRLKTPLHEDLSLQSSLNYQMTRLARQSLTETVQDLVTKVNKLTADREQQGATVATNENQIVSFSGGPAAHLANDTGVLYDRPWFDDDVPSSSTRRSVL